MLQFLLFLCLGLLIYTYAGYGLLITLLAKIRNSIKPVHSVTHETGYTPQVTLVIHARNKMTCLPAKLQNLSSLDYPTDRLSFLFLTEESTDGSTEWLESLRDDGVQQIEVQGGLKRMGKVAAVNHAMKSITSPIVIFSDADAQLNSLAIRNLVRHFQDERVGAVIGQKRIDVHPDEPATAECLYWGYESYLKRQDARFNTVVGATGELFAMRAALYEPLEPTALRGNFISSIRVAAKGYHIPYEPDAYTLERPSFSIHEAHKRAGSLAVDRLQSVICLAYLLNITQYSWLSFQYISHWLLRWVITPFCLPIIWLVNLAQILPVQLKTPLSVFWTILFIVQCLLYGLAYIGYRSRHQPSCSRVFSILFYVTLINVCAIQGLIRYWRSNPSGIWNKSRRTDDIELQTS